MVQLSLPFSIREGVDFDQWVIGANAEVYMLSQAVAIGEQYHSIYFWGQSGTGKSHLLQAVCDLAHQSGLRAFYVPLNQYANFNTTIFDSLDDADIVCIDDIECIAGDDEWEQALLGLYIRLRGKRNSLLMTGTTGCRDLAFQLLDLKSRVGGDLIYHIQPLSDEDKIHLLQIKAKVRTFAIPQDVATYLLRYVKRDLPSLLGLLDRFDHATSSQKHKLTVPFVKSLLQEDS